MKVKIYGDVQAVHLVQITLDLYRNKRQYQEKQIVFNLENGELKKYYEKN
jgi:hypothetical protein